MIGISLRYSTLAFALGVVVTHVSSHVLSGQAWSIDATVGHVVRAGKGAIALFLFFSIFLVAIGLLAHWPSRKEP